MIIHNEFPQRTLEWHELKWGKIGGTLSKGLLNPTDTLFIDIISQIGEQFEPVDEFENEATRRGNDFEPFGMEYIESYSGLRFNKPMWLQCEENKIIGISPDGITEDETVSAEIKCFGRKKHWECILNDQIPLENIAQCIHYFTVNSKLEKLYFISFRPEAPKHFIKELFRDSIVNIGTNSKPINITISEAVKTSKKNANDLIDRIEKALDNLIF